MFYPDVKAELFQANISGRPENAGRPFINKVFKPLAY